MTIRPISSSPVTTHSIKGASETTQHPKGLTTTKSTLSSASSHSTTTTTYTQHPKGLTTTKSTLSSASSHSTTTYESKEKEKPVSSNSGNVTAAPLGSIYYRSIDRASKILTEAFLKRRNDDTSKHFKQYESIDICNNVAIRMNAKGETPKFHKPRTGAISELFAKISENDQDGIQRVANEIINSLFATKPHVQFRVDSCPPSIVDSVAKNEMESLLWEEYAKCVEIFDTLNIAEFFVGKKFHDPRTDHFLMCKDVYPGENNFFIFIFDVINNSSNHYLPPGTDSTLGTAIPARKFVSGLA